MTTEFNVENEIDKTFDPYKRNFPEANIFGERDMDAELKMSFYKYYFERDGKKLEFEDLTKQDKLDLRLLIAKDKRLRRI